MVLLCALSSCQRLNGSGWRACEKAKDDVRAATSLCPNSSCSASPLDSAGWGFGPTAQVNCEQAHETSNGGTRALHSGPMLASSTYARAGPPIFRVSLKSGATPHVPSSSCCPVRRPHPVRLRLAPPSRADPSR
jgi:hypothetical protein